MSTGNLPKYRFYLSEASSLSYEVFPLNFLATALVDSLEPDQIFYRRTFNGSLIFGSNSIAIDDTGTPQNRKDDFQLLWGQEQHDKCAKLYLTITRTISGATTTYWEGEFSTTDGKFDLDRCTFEVTPRTLDDYTDIMPATEIQYDVLALCASVTTRAIQGTSIDVTYTRGKWLWDLIEAMGGYVLPGVTVSSEFFTNATNPATLHASHTNHLTIHQKSDILRPTATNGASGAMMSWKELSDILWGMFQVKWNYDLATDTINVEHISWFSSGIGIDIQTDPLCKAQNKYNYDKPEMPKYEKFYFMEAFNPDFVGINIYYESDCVDQDPKTNFTETKVNVTTDLDYMINTPEEIADEGFVILCNDVVGGLNYVRVSTGAYHNDVRLNMDLSWANLHNCYFRHNRVLIEGRLNGSVVTFWSAKKTIQQEVNATICDIDHFDPSDKITSELGETYLNSKAKVKKAEIDPTGLAKLSLLYGPADNTNTGVADARWILVQENGAGHFFSTLSEAADHDYVIHVVVVIFESDGDVVCSSAEQDFTVPTGATTFNFNVTLCGSIPSGGYIYYPLFRMTEFTLEGWGASVIYDPAFQEPTT